MKPIEIPEFLVLRGEEAIWALFDFMHELEEERGRELTEKQTNALIKITKGLISSIGGEMRSGTSDEDVKEPKHRIQIVFNGNENVFLSQFHHSQ